MAAYASAAELRKMSAQDLSREAAGKRADVAKLRMNVRLGNEKDTAKLRKERVQLARILTALSGKNAESAELNDKPKTSKLPAPSPKSRASSSSKK